MDIEFNIRGILAVFFRQKWKFLLVFLAIFGFGIHYLMNAQTIYESRGSFLVRFGAQAKPSVNITPDLQPAEFSYSDRKETMESYIEIMQSDNLLVDTVTDVGAERLFPGISNSVRENDTPERAAARRMHGKLEIETVDRSNIIEVKAKHQDPQLAAEFALTLMEHFMLRQAEFFETPQAGFLKQQIEDVRRQLDEAQAEFLAFKQKVGVSEIDTEMQELLAEKRDLSRIAFQQVAEAQTRVAELEGELEEARGTYRNDSTIVKQLRSNLITARDQLNERRAEFNADDAESALSSKIVKIDERIAFLEEQRGVYNDLEQKVSMAQQNLNYYQQRAEEARVNNLLNQQNITRISIIDTPVTPLNPVAPKKKLIIVAFLMLAAVMGSGVVLAFELIDDRFSTPEQITRKTGLPVLATFGRVKGA